MCGNAGRVEAVAGCTQLILPPHFQLFRAETGVGEPRVGLISPRGTRDGLLPVSQAFGSVLQSL